MKFFNYFHTFSCINFKSNDRVIKSRKKGNEDVVNEHDNEKNGNSSLIIGRKQANKNSTRRNKKIRHNKFSIWVYYFILNNYRVL